MLIGRRAALNLPFDRLIEDFARALGRVQCHAGSGCRRPPPHMRAQGRAPDMTDQKNTILAIVLSALVLIAWQYFVGLPQMEKQKQEAQLKASSSNSSRSRRRQQPGQAGPVGAAPASPARRPRPGPAGRPARPALTREAVIKASPARRDRYAEAERLDFAQGRAASTISR